MPSIFWKQLRHGGVKLFNFFWRVALALILSPYNSDKATDFELDEDKTVDISGVKSRLAKAVTRKTLQRCGAGATLKALCYNARRLDRGSGLIDSLQFTEQKAKIISFPTRSTEPLLQGI